MSALSRRVCTLSLAATLVACSPSNPAPDAPVADASDEASDVTDLDAPPSDVVAPTCTFTGAAEPEVPAPPIHTPRWAFEPWISKDISTADDTRAFVRGFRERDIPVGVVVLDSPWETNYNTFVPHPVRYANFQGLLNELHADNIRLVLWVTQMVNRTSYDLEIGGDTYTNPSPNYEEGRRCGFYVNNGTAYMWWKGFGSGVDFFNGRARTWWHQQQNALLDMGLDGWKLDFGEDYITTPMHQTAAGMVTAQAYSEAYYRDYLTYGVGRRGRENFLTMVRPYDRSYQFPGRFYARREHAPVAWVGDNRRDWVGLSDALDHIFRSAAAGYVVVGSDVGGYLDRDDRVITDLVPASQDTFARWTAMSALGPFMQLHGRANSTPWTVEERPEETVTLYRYWSKLHHELVPFMYSLAEESYANNTTIIRPIGEMASWAGDYRYNLGEAFLVAPVLDGTGRRDVALPEGRFYDWWSPTADAVMGNQTLRAVDTTNRTRIPLYVRAGAIVPMDVSDAVTGLGTTASRGALTVLAYPSSAMSRFVLHDEDNMTTTIAMRPDGDATEITLSRSTKPVLLRVREDSRFAQVTLGGTMIPTLEDRAMFDAASTAMGVLHDAATRSVWVKLPASTTPRTLRFVLR